MKLLRLATVWARRSFEDDEPLDRADDERVLRAVVAALTKHRDVPLVRSSGGSVVRESSLRDAKLYRLVLAAVRSHRAAPIARRGPLSRRLKDAFRRVGIPLHVDVRTFADELPLGGAPSTLAGQILSKAGMKSYRSIAETKRSAAKARTIRRRRTVTRLEVIEYFLACLQVPEENLFAIAAAVDAVCEGGMLTATPRNWGRRSALGPAPKPPSKRPKYVRYGTALLSDATIGVLSDEYQPEDQDFE